MSHYNTDKPALTPDKDEFQRAAFVKRLAYTLLSPSNSDSIVVGLYGRWGEGKSSVLNFVEHELKKAEPVPVIIHINPWRFPDESQLLLDFFKKLTNAIGRDLLSRGEKIVDAITKYAPMVMPTFNYGIGSTDPGKNLQAIGSLVQPSIEELYARVDDTIAESKKRVIIIIDDIDRLEKQQIQAVFRLIKLTASFRNTAYLLAFDDLMVARAIGELFAPGADAASPDVLSAGQNFLEKIIQVPLRLPKARQQDLLNHCFNHIHQVLKDTQTELDSEKDQQIGKKPNYYRFADAFRSGVVAQLSTPRLAIRYANAIRFSLPLLAGEINSVDLLLVEALNIFYPDLYHFVAARQDVFAGSSQRVMTFNLGNGESHKPSDIVEEFIQNQGYSVEAKSGAKSILLALFPRLGNQRDMWADLDVRRNELDEAELHRLKSVASPEYYSRYFSYSVAGGDVSDREFDAFLNKESSDQTHILHNFIERLSTPITLTRLEYRLPNLNVTQTRNLFNTFLQTAHIYQPNRNWNQFESGEVTRVSKLVLQLVEKLPDTQERLQLIYRLLEAEGSFELAYQVDQRLQIRWETEQRQPSSYDDPNTPQPLLTVVQWEEVLSKSGELLLKRALHEADGRPLYQTHLFRASKLLIIIWPRIDLPPGPVEYVMSFLRQRPSEVVDFLKACGQAASVGNGPFYKVGLDLADFDRLRDLFGQQLYTIVREQLGDEVVERVSFGDYDEPTPKQRLQQFVYLYEHRLAAPSVDTLSEPMAPVD